MYISLPIYIYISSYLSIYLSISIYVTFCSASSSAHAIMIDDTSMN